MLSRLGVTTCSGKIGTQRFTAHPKTDPETGEMFTFSYSVDKQPYCESSKQACLKRNGRGL